LIEKRPCESDGRQTLLSLTAAGKRAFAPLDKRSGAKVAAMLGGLAEPEQKRLVGAMATIEQLLDVGAERQAPYLLRPHRPGDIGWVIHRHGVLYAEEYGWDQTFEALVAEIAAKFIRDFDPKRERCWIAERAGENVGSVFLVRQSDEVAKLRLLLVDPSARGLGIGRRLVEECIGFARRTGYRRIELWTNDVLVAARRIYEAAGFRLMHQEPHCSFGHDLVSQTWQLEL
jgi:GNAT superfamily N-acetyltransferase